MSHCHSTSGTAFRRAPSQSGTSSEGGLLEPAQDRHPPKSPLRSRGIHIVHSPVVFSVFFNFSKGTSIALQRGNPISCPSFYLSPLYLPRLPPAPGFRVHYSRRPGKLGSLDLFFSRTGSASPHISLSSFFSSILEALCFFCPFFLLLSPPLYRYYLTVTSPYQDDGRSSYRHRHPKLDLGLTTWPASVESYIGIAKSRSG